MRPYNDGNLLHSNRLRSLPGRVCTVGSMLLARSVISMSIEDLGPKKTRESFVISTCSVLAHMLQKLAPDSHVPEGKLEPHCSTQPLSWRVGVRCGLAWKRFTGKTRLVDGFNQTLMTLKHTSSR